MYSHKNSFPRPDRSSLPGQKCLQSSDLLGSEDSTYNRLPGDCPIPGWLTGQKDSYLCAEWLRVFERYVEGADVEFFWRILKVLRANKPSWEISITCAKS